ncbi:hypothetical protein [Desulfurobacterium sp.]
MLKRYREVFEDDHPGLKISKREKVVFENEIERERAAAILGSEVVKEYVSFSEALKDAFQKGNRYVTQVTEFVLFDNLDSFLAQLKTIESIKEDRTATKAAEEITKNTDLQIEINL